MLSEKITFQPDAELFDFCPEVKNEYEQYIIFLDSLNETEAREYLELALEGEILAKDGDEADYVLTQKELGEIATSKPEASKLKDAAIKERWHPSIKAYDDLANIYADSHINRKILIDLVKKAKRKPTCKMLPKLVAAFMHEMRELPLAHRVEAAALIADSATLQNFFEEYSTLFRIQHDLADLRISDIVKDLPREGKKEIINFYNDEIIRTIAKLIQKEIKAVSN